MNDSLTKNGVSVALNSLAEAWPNLKTKCGASIVQSTVFNVARDMRASDRDLTEAVRDLVRTGGMITTAVGIPDLLATALSKGRSTARPQNYDCTERLCYKGLLEIQLSNGYTTTVNCPYCDAGRRRQVHDAANPPRNLPLDDSYYQRKNEMVKASLKAYDIEVQKRLRKREGFKYE
jgi:hypothetical protein